MLEFRQEIQDCLMFITKKRNVILHRKITTCDTKTYTPISADITVNVVYIQENQLNPPDHGINLALMIRSTSFLTKVTTSSASSKEPTATLLSIQSILTFHI